MNRRVRLLISATVILLLVGCSQSGPTITGDEVIVKTDQIDVHFSRVRPFAMTYMIFGGMETNQRNAFTRVTLSGLDIYTAKSIYARYPDFHMCKSPGAPLAQREIRQLEIVPVDSKVMKRLKKTLAEDRASIKNGGERVCVRLEGHVLKLTSAVVREMDRDIINDLPPQVHHEYFLVESVVITKAGDALTG